MNETEALDALVRVWVRDIAPTVGKRCCILAARTTALVLDYYGVSNRVLGCDAFVANDAALKLMGEGVPFTEWPEGAWSQFAGDHNHGTGYGGHVVVLTTSGAFVDLSAGQFHRSNRIAIDGPRVWRDYIERDGFYLINEGTTWVQLTPKRDDRYRKATDWRHGREVAARIIRTINNERINK